MAGLRFSNLVRTLASYFRIGDIRIKDNGGVVETRDADDTAYADVGVKATRIHGTNTDAVILTVPGSLAGNVTFVLPGADGATGQVLSTDGAGTLSFTDVDANANKVESQAFTEASSSPVTVFTPSANAVLMTVVIDVTAAAAGGAPTVTLGTATDPDAYMTVSESDLTEAGLYVKTLRVTLGASPDAVILTITPSAQTFSGDVYISYATPS